VAPKPLRATLCGEPVALSAIFRAALRLPAPPGVNTSDTLQLAPVANVEPQVFALVVKSVEFTPENVKPLKETPAPDGLLRITLCAVPLAPTIIDPKLKAPGATVSVGAVPVPDKAAVCGELPAESVKLRTAERAPNPEGVNVNDTLQLDPVASDEPQVFAAIEKSAELTPVSAIPLISALAPDALLSVTLCCALFTPVTSDPKLNEAGASDKVGAVPDPDSETDCGELAAESVSIKVAVRVPAALGAKANETLQLAAAASDPPHVDDATEKSPPFVPVSATP